MADTMHPAQRLRRQTRATAEAKQRECVDKMPMGRRAALRAARVISQRGDAVHAYPCEYDHPGRWHVGTDWERS